MCKAAASVHQHLGEALLANDGVDDERVASRSGDVGGMVPRLKVIGDSDQLRKEGTAVSAAHASL